MDRIPASFDFPANRQTLLWLLVPVLLLPIGTTVLFIFARVFALLNDAFSASILNGMALVFSILWCLSLVLLVLCMAFLLLREESE